MRFTDADSVNRADVQNNALKAWTDRVPGRIAVVAVLYENTTDPLSAWFEKLGECDLTQAYLVLPASTPALAGHERGFAQHPVLASGVRWQTIHSDEMQTAQGCLCCAMKSEVNMLLGQLFMRLLARREPAVQVVFLMTKAANADSLAQTLQHAPFLAQRYALSGEMQLG